jgi:hypothetical protein
MRARDWHIRIRQCVRRWLGTEDLPSTAMLHALEQAQRKRHAKLLAALDRIENMKRQEILDPVGCKRHS